MMPITSTPWVLGESYLFMEKTKIHLLLLLCAAFRLAVGTWLRKNKLDFLLVFHQQNSSLNSIFDTVYASGHKGREFPMGGKCWTALNDLHFREGSTCDVTRGEGTQGPINDSGNSGFQNESLFLKKTVFFYISYYYFWYGNQTNAVAKHALMMFLKSTILYMINTNYVQTSVKDTDLTCGCFRAYCNDCFKIKVLCKINGYW